MSTIGTLGRCQSAMDDAVAEMEMEMSKSRSKSSSGSDSLPKTVSDLEELGKLSGKKRLSFADTASASSASASSNSRSSKQRDREVKLQERVIRVIERRANQMSMNIMLVVKYMTSPLRLYLKFLVKFEAPANQAALVASIKAPKRIIDDFMSEWGAMDMLGLKMLIKMRRLKTQTFSSLKSNADFMALTQPGANSGMAYALYNELMHPGKEYENILHQWFDSFMADDHELLESVGFEANDTRRALVKELAFSLNTHAFSVTVRPLKFKHLEGGAVVEKSITCESALHAIYSKLTSVKDPKDRLHPGVTYEMLDAENKYAYDVAKQQFDSANGLAQSMDSWAAVDDVHKTSNGRPVM